MEIDAKQNVKDQADSTGLESNIGDRFGLLEPDTGNHTTIGKSLQDNSTKQFIAFIIICSLSLVVISYRPSFVDSVIVSMLGPLCTLSFISVLPICSSLPNIQEPRFAELVTLQMQFGSILEYSGSATYLLMNIKESEIAVRDLNTLIKASEFASKNLIIPLLDAFVVRATATGRHLSRLEASINGGADSIVAIDTYATNKLEAIDQNIGAMSIASTTIDPFSFRANSRNDIFEVFNQVADALELGFRQLIEISTAADSLLGQLNSHLLTIHEVVSQEEGGAKLQRGEALAYLWMHIGRGQAKLARFAGHPILLSQVEKHRSTAVEYVKKIVSQLERLSKDLSALREPANRPLMPDGARIPLEMHIATLRICIEQLNELRARAKAQQDHLLTIIIDGPQYPELGP